ncbi:unnamed protein product [Urochloa decumbens]|uniref:F-box domain-containing protein n=1 Tax=Urochloa decumbens TaxID=240449 RepID=A0ABC9GL34_9POAL
MAAEEASVSSPSGGKRRKVVVAPRVALAAALPDEMVTEVLLNLPVKSILRFRAVSRAWAALLSSDDFCGLHMAAVASALAPAPPPKLLFVSPSANFASTAVYSCSPSSGDHGHGHEDEHLFTLDDARGNFVDVAPAPCHGLTLLYDALAPAHYACAGDARAVTPAYYVCNAATRAVTRLPPCEEVAYATAGIGFDARAREYKVVRLFQGGPRDGEQFKCQVYTLGGEEDRWRPVARGVPFRFCKFALAAILCAAIWKVPPVFAGGFLHWLIDPVCLVKKPRAAILSFSLTSETFSWVRSPKFPVSGAHLVELDGHLCMVRDLRRDYYRYRPTMLEIWKLKDDYSSGEWSLKHRVELSRNHMAITRGFVEPKAVRVIGSFGDSKCSERIIIATSGHEVFACDPVSGALETIHSTMEIQPHQIEAYDIRFSLFRETLVPVPKTKEEMALSSPLCRATKEILLRLPAKSVLNFKLVCKQWLRLIRTESFSRPYFSHKNIDKRLKITLVGKGTGEPDFSFIPLNKWLHQQAPDQSTFLDTKVVCSKPCHGLNLISTEIRDYLYNPCLGFRRIYRNEGPVQRRFCRLHPDSVQSEEHHFTIGNKNVGLGFDPLTQEHVIVEIFYNLKNYESRDYDLSCSLWNCNRRGVQNIPPPPLPVSDMPPAYLEGMLYWMSEPRLGHSHERAIVSFNIGTRMFGVIPCPSRIARSWDSHSPRRAFVAELEGVLYAVLANQVRDELCLWKWEHGQWDRSYTIYLKSCLDYSPRTNIVVPWAIDPTDGRILLNTGMRLGFYDPVKQGVENYIALDQVPILKRKEQIWCPGDTDQMLLDQPSNFSTSSGRDLSHSIDQSEELNGMSCNLSPLVPMLYEENLAYYPVPARARILLDFPI